jgi:hypothetical protein
MATAKKTAKAATPARKAAPVKSKPRATVKTAARPVAAPRSAPEPVKAAKAPKAEKPKKPKLVRDSFTIPKVEYAVLEQLKQRAAQSGAPVKKSELLRAGIKALAAMGDAPFRSALGAVPAIKTGRPAKT